MTDTMTLEVEDSLRARLVKPAEFPCCGRGASLGDDRLTEIADQLAQGADEVVVDRKCGGVDCKDPETGRRGIRYRLHVRYSPANGLCGDLPLLRAEWERVGATAVTVAPAEPVLEPVMFPIEQWADEITPAVIRAWARDAGIPCGARGRIHPTLRKQFEIAHA